MIDSARDVELARTSPTELYRIVLDRMLPSVLQEPTTLVEIFGISPERNDPFAAGSRDPQPLEAFEDVLLARPYPVRRASNWHSGQTSVSVLNVFVSPVEWQGPDDAILEAGIDLAGCGTGHWVWRLGRLGTTWTVLRCELLWRG